MYIRDYISSKERIEQFQIKHKNLYKRFKDYRQMKKVKQNEMKPRGRLC